MVCEHKACQACIKRLWALQEKYNSTHLGPEDYAALKPMVICPQCYHPTFLKEVRRQDEPVEYRTDYKKCLPTNFVYRLHEAYEFVKPASGPQRCNAKGIPAAWPEVQRPWFWAMDWCEDRSSKALDSEGWEYAEPMARGGEALWSPRPPPMLNRLSLASLVTRRRRYVRVALQIRNASEGAAPRAYLMPPTSTTECSLDSASGLSEDSVPSSAAGLEDTPLLQNEVVKRAEVEAEWLEGLKEIKDRLHCHRTETTLLAIPNGNAN
eukprot:EG_transcript_18759